MTWLHWSMCSAVFAALTAILAKLGVQNVDSNVATAVRTTVVVVASWMIVGFTKRPEGPPMTVRTVTFLVLSGLATAASWLCYFRALQIGKASQVAPVDKLSVVLTIVLAAIVLGEKITWMHWLGGGLIAAGVIVLART